MARRLYQRMKTGLKVATVATAALALTYVSTGCEEPSVLKYFKKILSTSGECDPRFGRGQTNILVRTLNEHYTPLEGADPETGEGDYQHKTSETILWDTIEERDAEIAGDIKACKDAKARARARAEQEEEDDDDDSGGDGGGGSGSGGGF